MSERAEELAKRFEQTHGDAVALVEGMTEAQWRALCADDARTVAGVTYHVAGALDAVSGWVRAIASDQPPPQLTHEMIDASNARLAAAHPDPDRQETLALLQRNGAAAASLIRGLSDEQLDRTGMMPVFDGQALSAEQVVKYVLIHHIKGHFKAIRATLGA